MYLTNIFLAKKQTFLDYLWLRIQTQRQTFSLNVKNNYPDWNHTHRNLILLFFWRWLASKVQVSPTFPILGHCLQQIVVEVVIFQYLLEQEERRNYLIHVRSSCSHF